MGKFEDVLAPLSPRQVGVHVATDEEKRTAAKLSAEIDQHLQNHFSMFQEDVGMRHTFDRPLEHRIIRILTEAYHRAGWRVRFYLDAVNEGRQVRAVSVLHLHANLLHEDNRGESSSSTP